MYQIGGDSEMIQLRTILEIADNSGAKKASCIKVVGRSAKKYAEIGVCPGLGIVAPLRNFGQKPWRVGHHLKRFLQVIDSTIFHGGYRRFY